MPKITNSDALMHLRARRTCLDSEFSKMREEYVNIRDYILPKHSRQLDSDDGGTADEENREPDRDLILDSLATRSMDAMAAGLMTGLFSRARPWFKLTTPDPALNDVHAVKKWLAEVERRMLDVFSKSNFYNSAHQGFYELGGFGTSAMSIVEDLGKVMRCRQYTIGEYRLGLNDKLKVDTIYRSLFMTAGQMVSRWGEDSVSNAVKSAWKRKGGSDQRFQVEHVVEPNDGRYNLEGPTDRFPFRSIFYESNAANSNTILDVEGFLGFPVIATRWDVIGRDVYGTSPCMTVLPDVRGLQYIREKIMVAIDKMIDPPLDAPESMAVNGVDITAGGLNFSDNPTHRLQPVHVPNFSIRDAREEAEETRMAIRSGLFTDLFLMLSTQPLGNSTATEIVERHEEKLLMLGPMVSRFHGEFADPTIERVFELMDEARMIPEAPPQLQGTDLHVEYISILAQAQKMVGTTALEQYAGFVGRIASVAPTVLDKMDADQMVDEYADSIGVSPNVVRSDEDVLEVREQRAQQEAAAQAMAMAASAAQTTQTLAETPVGESSALDSMLGIQAQ